MSSNADDNRSGFKNSRIDLSQLGDDGWSRPLSGIPANPGPRRKVTAATASAASRGKHLDELFESRVHAATARRAVKQNRGQNRVWLFAGGLFMASVGGIAAAYYLVGPPMAMSAQGTSGVEYQAAQTSSLEVDSSVAATSSHFQGVPVSATMPGSTTDYSSETPVMVLPPADVQVEAADKPVAPAVSEHFAATEPVAAVPATTETEATVTDAAEIPIADQRQLEATAVESPEDTTIDQAQVAETAQSAETERMVRIEPTAVSEEIETKTNVNTATKPAAPGATGGQWVALPTEPAPAASPIETAAAEQQSGETGPVAGPAKSQQELFKEFQAYLEITGHKTSGNNEGQQELFNKFIRWSVEAPKGN